MRLALNYLTYALSATVLGPLLCRGRYDVVFVCETSPVTVGIPACMLKWLKRAPMLFWVLDLWPESVAAAGGVKSRAVLRAIGAVVRFIYRRCDRILISSRGFSSNVLRYGGDERRIRYFPNWAQSVPQDTAADQGHDLPALPEGFRVMFAGNIGEAQAFPTILDAAERLREHADVHWIVLGDGRAFDWVKAQVEQRALAGNFHLLGRFPAESMPHFFAAADALLVTLKQDPVFALTVPAKVQSYMQSGRPIIGALDGEGASLIRQSGAGLACPAENAEELARAVLTMYRMPREEREQMGRSGEAYCREHFDRRTLVDRLETWIQEALAERAAIQSGRSQ